LAFADSSKTDSSSGSVSPSRIFGTGEMADLVRAFDWSATALGPIDSWTDPLLTSVNLLLCSRHPMFLWWGPDAIQFYNDAYRPSFGVGTHHPGALGQTARECWTEIWDQIESRLNVVMHQGQATWNENQLVPILRNGQLEDVYWTWSDSPVRDATGNVVGVMVTCTETTHRVIAERELYRSGERLKLALDCAELGTWSYNPQDGNFTADERMQRMFGARQPTGEEDFWQQLLHPDDRLAAREEFAAALAGVRRYHLEYRVLHPEGIRWIRSKGNALSAEGTAKAMFAIVEDITEAKLAEIKLRDSTRDFREAQRIGRMGSWRLLLATGEVIWSDEVYRLLERDPSLPVINYATQPETMEPESLRRLEAAVAQCIATGQSYELDTKMYLPDTGKAIWLSTRGEPLFNAEGQVVELRGTVRDITDRKLAEEALRDSEERLRLALAAARDMGSFDWDIQADRCIADARFCAIFGINAEDGRRGLSMATALANVHPEDWPEVERRARHTLDTGEDFVMDYRVQSNAQTLRWVSARGNCLRTDTGAPTRFTGVVLDITERRLAEQALLRTEKLAAVGRLASSIAHEINNPLEAVTNLLYLARHTDDVGESREYLALADTELRRASAITSQTLRFHKQSTRPTEVTCEDLMGSTLEILRSRIANANVTVKKRQRARRPVLCFEGEIRQVISNLVINAIDAMQARGGVLFLRSREGHDYATGRPGLLLTIADTGTGMPPEVFARIFEPFYTTKGIHGTGLGLWISKEIVDRHHGFLYIRSSQGLGHTGTLVSVFLPFAAATRAN
jgi:PAS domain S-box-containing protein